MGRIFDYIFYRITELTFKRSGRRGLPAISIISIMQGFLVGTVINLIANHFIAKTTREHHYKSFGYVGAIISILLFNINYSKYTEKYNKLKYKWRDEDPVKRIFNGVLVVIFLILPPIIFTIMSNFTH